MGICPDIASWKDLSSSVNFSFTCKVPLKANVGSSPDLSLGRRVSNILIFTWQPSVLELSIFPSNLFKILGAKLLNTYFALTTCSTPSLSR